MGSCKGFAPEKCVHLKETTWPHVKIRDWVIKEILSNGHLLLFSKHKRYTLEVLKEDVELKCCR
jgi:hypothetical protein